MHTIQLPTLPQPRTESGDALVAVRISFRPVGHPIFPDGNVCGTKLLGQLLANALEYGAVCVVEKACALPFNSAFILFTLSCRQEIEDALKIIERELTALDLIGLAVIASNDPHEGILRSYSPKGQMLEFPSNAELEAHAKNIEVAFEKMAATAIKLLLGTRLPPAAQ